MTAFESAIACRVLQQCKSEHKFVEKIVAASVSTAIFLDGSNEAARSRIDEPGFRSVK
jgi:hypothetical protein